MPFLQKTGLRLVYFSLGEAVYKVPLHIGGSHSALLSRHPDIRKRQSAVMHYGQLGPICLEPTLIILNPQYRRRRTLCLRFIQIGLVWMWSVWVGGVMWCNALIMVQPWPRQHLFVEQPRLWPFHDFMPGPIHFSSANPDTDVTKIMGPFEKGLN